MGVNSFFSKVCSSWFLDFFLFFSMKFWLLSSLCKKRFLAGASLCFPLVREFGGAEVIWGQLRGGEPYIQTQLKLPFQTLGVWVYGLSHSFSSFSESPCSHSCCSPVPSFEGLLDTKSTLLLPDVLFVAQPALVCSAVPAELGQDWDSVYRCTPPSLFPTSGSSPSLPHTQVSSSVKLFWSLESCQNENGVTFIKH